MMMDATNLAQSINSMLSRLDEHFTAARKEVDSVKPDLTEAARHSQAAHGFLGDIAVTIMRAESFLGISQPPDVINRVNTLQQRLSVVDREINAYNSILVAHTKRIADPKRVAN